MQADERLFFISRGIDYEFEIHLNEKQIYHQEGMFTPVKLDITDFIQEFNELKVIIYPIPKNAQSSG